MNVMKNSLQFLGARLFRLLGRLPPGVNKPDALEKAREKERGLLWFNPADS